MFVRVLINGFDKTMAIVNVLAKGRKTLMALSEDQKEGINKIDKSVIIKLLHNAYCLAAFIKREEYRMVTSTVHI